MIQNVCIPKFSILIDQPMFKRVVRGFVRCIQEPMYFTVGSMLFHYFFNIAKIALINLRMCAFIFFFSLSTLLLYCLILKLLKILILKVCRMYNVFGSDGSHKIYTQFIEQSGVHNNRK